FPPFRRFLLSPYTTLFRSIWGFQLLVGIPFAIFTKLNKVLFIAAANISIPPFIPFIIYGSYKMGELVLGKPEVELPKLSEITLEDRKSTRLNSSHVKISYA